MRAKGSFNRRNGKTTPRKKAKTHWGAHKSPRRSRTSKKASH